MECYPDEASPSALSRLLKPFHFVVDEQIQGQYLEALEDYHLRYVVGRHRTAPVVHPGILLSHSNATRGQVLGQPNTQWIHQREQTNFIAPAYLGDQLVVDWKIEGQERWMGRTITCVSCTVTGQGRRRILDRTMWGFRISVERPISGSATRPADGIPGMPPSRPPSLDPHRWLISGRSKWPTPERIRLFSGFTSDNLHNSREVAKQAGLPAPVVSAAQGMGYLCEFMIDNVGESWLAGGSWTLTFRRPAFPNDRISASGTLRDVTSAGGDARFALDLRLVNQFGVTTTRGTAVAHTSLTS